MHIIIMRHMLDLIRLNCQMGLIGPTYWAITIGLKHAGNIRNSAWSPTAPIASQHPVLRRIKVRSMCSFDAPTETNQTAVFDSYMASLFAHYFNPDPS